jgi:hypothetical protein
MGGCLVELLHSLVLLAGVLLWHVHLLATWDQLTGPILYDRQFLGLDILEDAEVVLVFSELLFSIDCQPFLGVNSNMVLLWSLYER